MPSVAVFRINFVPLSAKDEVIMNHWEYILQSTKAEMKEVLSENDKVILGELQSCGDYQENFYRLNLQYFCFLLQIKQDVDDMSLLKKQS